MTDVASLEVGDEIAHLRMRGPFFPVLSIERLEEIENRPSDLYRVDLGNAGVHFWNGTDTVVVREKVGAV